MIDTGSEIERIGCKVWTALNGKIKQGRTNGGWEITYVSNPYLGHLVGIDKGLQQACYAAINRCNVPR